jgi:hypothetical protein
MSKSKIIKRLSFNQAMSVFMMGFMLNSIIHGAHVYNVMILVFSTITFLVHATMENSQR